MSSGKSANPAGELDWALAIYDRATFAFIYTDPVRQQGGADVAGIRPPTPR